MALKLRRKSTPSGALNKRMTKGLKLSAAMTATMERMCSHTVNLKIKPRILPGVLIYSTFEAS